MHRSLILRSGSLLSAMCLSAWTCTLAVAADPQPAAESASISPAVEVFADIKPSCPRPGCRAASYHALTALKNVKSVDPDVPGSTMMRIHLGEAGLPDPAQWKTEFQKQLDTASELRGVVVKLTGKLAETDNRLSIDLPGLAPIEVTISSQRLRWTAAPSQSVAVTITGLLTKNATNYSVELQEIRVLPDK